MTGEPLMGGFIKVYEVLIAEPISASGPSDNVPAFPVTSPRLASPPQGRAACREDIAMVRFHAIASKWLTLISCRIFVDVII